MNKFCLLSANYAATFSRHQKSVVLIFLFCFYCIWIVDSTCNEKNSELLSESDFDSRIVGGQEAKPYEVPSLVSLHTQSSGHFCAGSIVNSKWILTAATCIKDLKAKWVNVLGGKFSLSSADQSKQIRAGKRIVFHPKYKSPFLDYNVALLELFSPFNINLKEVKPALLASADFVPNYKENAVVYGWGQMSENGKYSDLARRVTIPLVDPEDCSNFYFPIETITSNMICAGTTGKDSCWGDGGAPMYCKSKVNLKYSACNTEKVLCGIVSFKFGCGRPERPGIYSRVSSVIGWIRNETIWKQF